MMEMYMDEISEDLNNIYGMNTKVIEGVIVTQEFNGKININTYKEFEELAISICNMIREETDFDCNYIIGDCDYEFKIEIL